MYINSSNGAASIVQARETTAFPPTVGNRSFDEILKEASSTPVTSEKPGASSVVTETLITLKKDQGVLSHEDEQASPPLPEMSSQARNRFEQLLADMAERPDWAERWMHMCIKDSQGTPLFTLSCHPPRFVESGEIYTEEKQEYLFRIASLYEEGRKKLYEAELAKGTPLLEIVEKVFRYNCTMPEDFRRMTGW